MDLLQRIIQNKESVAEISFKSFFDKNGREEKISKHEIAIMCIHISKKDYTTAPL